jgi:hypothetical protein
MAFGKGELYECAPAKRLVSERGRKGAKGAALSSANIY